MTASQNPQPDPDPAQHHIARGDESSTGAEVHAGESAAPAIESPQGPAAGNGGVNGRREETVDGRAGGVLGRAVSGRGARWAALAIACVVAGTVASVLVARGVARDDEAKARTAFHQSVTSTGIASGIKVAVQQQEDLLVSAGTFFAANPKATAGELSAWAGYAHVLHRHPELRRLGFTSYSRAAEPAPLLPRVSSTAISRSLRSSREAALRLAAASRTPSYYCAAGARLTQDAGGTSTRSGGHCTVSHLMLSARNTGRSIYGAASIGHAAALSTITPVYRGGVVPATISGRRAEFVGWLREVLAPGVVLAQALRGHPDAAVRVRYRAGGANLSFSAGSPPADAQSTTTDLHDGWSVRSFGPPAGSGLFGDGRALVLMVGGVLLSLLLGALIFVLGTRARVRSHAAPVRRVPNEDLYDPLTGLPNRALMLDRAERLLARASRESGLLAGALFVDIDWFRDVNEKIGEAAGTQLLTIVAQRLEGVVRAQDSVGRLDGDEFVILVESAARGARLESLARRIIEALHKPVALDDFGPSFHVTASIGVAFGRYDNADDLLRDARLAMYAAKSAGKDRYTLFNANMRSVTESRAVLEVELSRALQERQFFLLYEPIYDLTARRVVALEALIRWMRPGKGVVDPSEFMPLAEETGLTVPIGRWVLEEATTRAAAWNVAGHRVGISVKVSASQLSRDGFATDVRRALQQSGIEPSLLTLEIGEETVMRDVAASAERLRELKQLGVRIAVEDFGSAYAYHSDLQRLPLDFLKVDRGSLAASEDEAYRRWLLQAILIVGRDLSLGVIASGIESHEQMIALQAMGCTMAQGPFMGTAVPAEAMATIFSSPFPSAPAEPVATPAGAPGAAVVAAAAGAQPVPPGPAAAPSPPAATTGDLPDPAAGSGGMPPAPGQ